MKIKLEIPSRDFVEMINALYEAVNKSDFDFKAYTTRNQIIEEGGYSFQFQVAKGYCHDTKQMEEAGKVIINIDTIPPKDK